MHITGFDWNGQWGQMQRLRELPNDVAFWDKKAPRFCDKETSPYYYDFRELTGIEPGERVLDVGCGSGTFAIPLAREGHEVVAMDISPMMLQRLREQQEIDQLTNITMVQGGWASDWTALGVMPASVDVAIASRSLAAYDLRDALAKLDATARRRVCLTLSAETLPYFDVQALKAIGRPHTTVSDYLYAVNILYEMDIKAEVRFIGAPKRDTFANKEEAWDRTVQHLGPLTSPEEAHLRQFLDEHLIPWQRSDGQEVLAKDYLRDLRWAFISWNKNLPEPRDYY